MDAYSNPSSQEYKALSRDLIDHLTTVLKASSYQADFLDVKVSNFQKGSIVFDFTIYFNSESKINENSLRDIIKKGEGGDPKFRVLQVDVRQKYPCKSPTEKPTEAPGLETWIIVLIACQGACILILLIIVLILLVGYFCPLQSTCALHQINRPLSSCFEPHYESEAKCKVLYYEN